MKMSSIYLFESTGLGFFHKFLEHVHKIALSVVLAALAWRCLVISASSASSVWVLVVVSPLVAVIVVVVALGILPPADWLYGRRRLHLILSHACSPSGPKQSEKCGWVPESWHVPHSVGDSQVKGYFPWKGWMGM